MWLIENSALSLETKEVVEILVRMVATSFHRRWLQETRAQRRIK
jgi:hypothetical protein